MKLNKKEEKYILKKEDFVSWHGWEREYKDYMAKMMNHHMLTEKSGVCPIKALVNQRKFGLYLDGDIFGLLAELLLSLNRFEDNIRL